MSFKNDQGAGNHCHLEGSRPAQPLGGLESQLALASTGGSARHEWSAGRWTWGAGVGGVLQGPTGADAGAGPLQSFSWEKTNTVKTRVVSISSVVLVVLCLGPGCSFT